MDKKKHSMKGLEADDIRKISEMLTDDPDVFLEEGVPMGPSDDMAGGDVPPPPAEDESPVDGGMPADMGPGADTEEECQWVVVKMAMGEEGGESEAWGPFMSREEADQECSAKAGEGAQCVVAKLTPAMPGEEDMDMDMGGEVEKMASMGGGEDPAMGGGAPAEEEMMGFGGM